MWDSKGWAKIFGWYMKKRIMANKAENAIKHIQVWVKSQQTVTGWSEALSAV